MKQLDCIIIGGGLAGLQAAIQLGRYEHETLVIDSNSGRSTLCHCYHNILGYPNGVSGDELRRLGREHASQYNISFTEDFAVELQQDGDSFTVKTKSQKSFSAKTILMATGIKDNIPPIKNLTSCLGNTVYLCPDCDGYEIKNKRTIVLGSGNAGAGMAAGLAYWTNDLIFINHNSASVDASLIDKLKQNNIKYIDSAIKEVIVEDGSSFKGVMLEDGGTVEADRGFIAFGGNKVNTELAKQIGLQIDEENKHVIVNPRTKETSVSGIWAAGDMTVHSEQAAIAMGDGLQAAIWIHKALLKQDTSSAN
ncbi:pyridine nucleotide-disulfide oxidoreductase [Bacillus sp. M6-12]|uniref:NAD(P)/FAD-dependent oxidoreductase n=1 Tax=Bacillus sp. M6-12 TaxID=2054166 RepID=UPI000C76E970|nr:NAD(P)/FAD-dependent oxidoreductase [Bacillus sp. M6-12]PLS17169.1 pyridine nucleotide-disulfide oxidoreductase [Bacillus sp. M6-12]